MKGYFLVYISRKISISYLFVGFLVYSGFHRIVDVERRLRRREIKVTLRASLVLGNVNKLPCFTW